MNINGIPAANYLYSRLPRRILFLLVTHTHTHTYLIYSITWKIDKTLFLALIN